jgi:hypothetical protein
MMDPPPRTRDFFWPHLQLQTPDLTHLDRPFTEEEIWQAICQMPQNKAPGPDGFTGHFFQTCWQIIHADVVLAITSATTYAATI